MNRAQRTLCKANGDGFCPFCTAFTEERGLASGFFGAFAGNTGFDEISLPVFVNKINYVLISVGFFLCFKAGVIHFMRFLSGYNFNLIINPKRG